MAKSDAQDTRGTRNKAGKKYGDKTIEVTIRFWTDGIAGEGEIIQKNAWDNGMILMKRNRLHGIGPVHSKPFNSILEVPAVIAKVLEEAGIVLHPNHKLRKIVKT